MPSFLALMRQAGLVTVAGGWARLVVVTLACMGAGATGATGIYSCVDASGRRQTSDRPIPDCLDREQRVLNKDGSQRQVLAPRQTPQEKAVAEEARQKRELAEMAFQDAVRRDRKLVSRYPDEAAHHQARQAALQDTRKSLATSEKRVADLKKERKGFLVDADFYQGKALPLKLRTALEGNQASQEAQARLIENHHAELDRINMVYDQELSRLKQLWAGAKPGTLPPDKPPSAPL